MMVRFSIVQTASDVVLMARERRSNGASNGAPNGALMAQTDLGNGGGGPWCAPCAIRTPLGGSNGAKDGAKITAGRSRLMARQWRTNGANRMAQAGLVLALLATLTACSDANGAKEALDDAGYSEISITGHSWTGCSDHDTYATGFVAKSPGGAKVSGVVCACMGWGKATTIRTFGRVRP